MRDFSGGMLFLIIVMTIIINPSEQKNIGCPFRIGLLHDNDTRWVDAISKTDPFKDVIGRKLCSQPITVDVEVLAVPAQPLELFSNRTAVDILKNRDILIGPYFDEVATFAGSNHILYYVTRPLDMQYLPRKLQKPNSDYVIEIWPTWSHIVKVVKDYYRYLSIQKVGIISLDTQLNTIQVGQAILDQLLSLNVFNETQIITYTYRADTKDEIYRKKEVDQIISDILYNDIKNIIFVSEGFTIGIDYLTPLQVFFDEDRQRHIDHNGFEFLIFNPTFRSLFQNLTMLSKAGNGDANLAYLDMCFFRPDQGPFDPYTVDNAAVRDIKMILNHTTELLRTYSLPTTEILASMMKDLTLPWSPSETTICNGTSFNGNGQRSSCFVQLWYSSIGDTSKGDNSNYRGFWSPGSQSFQPARRGASDSSYPPLTVLALPSRAYFTLRYGSDLYTGNDKYEGFFVDVFNDMWRTAIEKLSRSSNVSNTKFEFKYMPGMLYGKRQENGSWTGMFGILQSSNDPNLLMGVGGIFKTAARSMYFDFLPPVSLTQISFILSKEVKGHNEYFRFLRPYDDMVWIALTCVTVLAGCLVFGLERWNPLRDDIGREMLSPGESLWTSLLTITQGGAEAVFTIQPMRIFSVFYWFFAVIVLACYTGNLASFLLEPSFDRADLTFDDILNKDDIKVGIMDSGATGSFFRDSSALDRRLLYEKATKESNKTLAMKKVISENYVFLQNRVRLLFNAAADPGCAMTVSHARAGQFGAAWPLAWNAKAKHAELVKALSEALLNMRLTGRLHDLEKRWMDTKGKCSLHSHKNADTQQLEILHFSGLFMLVGAALVLAFVWLGLTKLYDRIHKEQIGKKNNRFHQNEKNEEDNPGFCDSLGITYL
ncbi:uncharacterized protein LOC135490734 [Lineus longissimus]|uniref:uncharacterized protein LOC135490734 n=1 Tax=Lineus longissimus TaxID=88925 RepID=UPI002B4CF30E